MSVPAQQPAAPADADGFLERARALHREAPLIDGHNDYPWALRQDAGGDLSKLDISQSQPSIMTDIPRLRAGGVGGLGRRAGLSADCMGFGGGRDVVRVMGDVQSRCGPLDVLVNNAGVVDRFARPLLDVPAEDIERLISINLQGPFLVTRAAIPVMAARGRGAIINIASGAGLRALPGRAAYGMTKAGVIGMTRALAVELAPLGIAVNAVLPGYVDTDILLARERGGRSDRPSVARAVPAAGRRAGEDVGRRFPE